jgi:hypothetical protein
VFGQFPVGRSWRKTGNSISNFSTMTCTLAHGNVRMADLSEVSELPRLTLGFEREDRSRQGEACGSRRDVSDHEHGAMSPKGETAGDDMVVDCPFLSACLLPLSIWTFPTSPSLVFLRCAFPSLVVQPTIYSPSHAANTMDYVYYEVKRATQRYHVRAQNDKNTVVISFHQA